MRLKNYALAAFRGQASRPNAPRPVAKSGRVAGSGVSIVQVPGLLLPTDAAPKEFIRKQLSPPRLRLQLADEVVKELKLPIMLQDVIAPEERV
jgi:hypothetical protein